MIGHKSAEAARARAYEVGVVPNDEFMLHPEPWPRRQNWCRAGVAQTARLPAERDKSLLIMLVNRFPLVREPTGILRYPEFAPLRGTSVTKVWHRQFAPLCGASVTKDWHRRLCAVAVVRTSRAASGSDSVPFDKMSPGYRRGWQAPTPSGSRQILIGGARGATGPTVATWDSAAVDRGEPT